MPVACLAFLMSLAYAVVTARSLYDDGTYYFLRVLQADGFTEMLFSRGHAAYLFQLPVVIALKLGIHDLPHLQFAFGIGCFCAWPLVMAMCLWLSPKNFWLVALACGAGYLNAAFVAVGEHVVTHAFFWPVCFAIVFVRPLTPAAAAMLLGSAAMLFRSYESMLFLGPVLGLLALRRASGEGKSWLRIVFLLAMILLFASVPISLDGMLHPCTSSNVGSFSTGLLGVLAAPGWTIGWTLFWVALMLACFFRQARQWLAHPASIVLLATGILLWGAWPLLAPAQLDPYKQYEARFLDLLVPLALLGVALIVAHRPQWLEAPRRQLVNLSASLLLAQSLWHLAATEQWRGYLNALRSLQSSRPGLINLMDSPYGKYPAVGHQATRFLWTGDARNLGIEISPPHVQSLILPGGIIYDQTLDENIVRGFRPAELPDLRRYGVDFDEYVRAVAQEPLLAGKKLP